MKKIWTSLLLFIILLYIEEADSMQMKISPAQLVFNSSSGERVCQKIKITCDSPGNVIGELKWSRNPDKKIEYYKYDSSYFKIIENYTKKIYFSKKDRKEANICITGQKEGKYSGLLIYRTERGYAGIGIWIELEVIKKKSRIIEMMIYSSPTLLLAIILGLLITNKKRLISNQRSYE